MIIKRFIFLTVLFLGFVFSPPSAVKPAWSVALVAPSQCTNCPYGSPVCVPVGTTLITSAARALWTRAQTELTIDNLTQWFAAAWDAFIGQILTFFDDYLEGNFMKWQDNLWAYDWRPALQNLMGQVNTGYVDYNQNYTSQADAKLVNDFNSRLDDILIEKRRQQNPSGNMCRAQTLTGGLARGNSYARAIRQASERDTVNSMTGTVGSPYEFGKTQALRYQWDRYCGFLVDPANNGGETGCPVVASPLATRNADVEPMRFVFDNMTIDVTKPGVSEALEAVKENLVNVVPPGNDIPEDALQGLGAREDMLGLRSYIARKMAARSVIEYVTSTRMPSNTDPTYINALRTEANIPLLNLSDTPSYRELMHLVSTEKFTSGKYNLDVLADMEQENLLRESLVLSSFYLMQLREKFEIMERGIMALSIQTAIELDQDISGDVN